MFISAEGQRYCVPVSDRERNGEYGLSVIGTSGRYGAAVCCNDLFSNGKTETGAVFFSAEEGFKYLICDIFRNATAVVGAFDDNVIIYTFCPEKYSSLPCDGLFGIAKKV